MPHLVHTPLFKNVLIAACMLASDIPCTVPRTTDTPQTDEPRSSMRIDNTNTKRARSKSTKRRRRSVVDSGATIHCIRDKSLFTHLDTSKTVSVRVADKRAIQSEGVGTCAIQLRSADGASHTVMLHNCIYSPTFSENLQ